MIGRNDLILLTIGDMTERSPLMRYGLPRDVSIDDLVAAGAVGDVMAQFVDASGQPIDRPINRRAIALPLEALRKVPNLVFASGGANKTHAIATVLRSGRGVRWCAMRPRRGRRWRLRWGWGDELLMLGDYS